MNQANKSSRGKGVYDVIIVGAGVYGSVIGYECARAGLYTAILEKDEYGQGASINSLNIIHGGLRYLQHLDISRIQRSLYSRHYFQKIAPERVDVVPFLLPLNSWGMQGPFTLKVALMLNDFIARKRNRGLPVEQHIPGGRVLSRHVVLEALPVLKRVDFNSAALWYEAVMNEPQKLIKGILSQAEIAGASVFVGTEACELRTHGNNVTGLHVRNERNQANTTINGHVVIDTTGRSENRLGEKLEGYSPRPLQWARGVNMLISRRIFGDYAIGLKHSDNVTDRESRLRGSDRNLFFVPRKDGTAIGTFYEHEKTVDGSLEISAQQCERYIDMVNSALPRDVIKAAEITGWNSGWLPVDEKSTPEQMNFIKSGSIRTIDVDGTFTGLIEVRSVKFTTAPAVARDVISLLATVGGFKLEQR